MSVYFLSTSIEVVICKLTGTLSRLLCSLPICFCRAIANPSERYSSERYPLQRQRILERNVYYKSLSFIRSAFSATISWSMQS